MASTSVICLHHACDEMPLNIKHKFLCLKFKTHLLSFTDHPTLSFIEGCWQERFPDSPGFCSFTMFTKIQDGHSITAAAFAYPEYSSLVVAETCWRSHSPTVRPSDGINVRCTCFLFTFTPYV